LAKQQHSIEGGAVVGVKGGCVCGAVRYELLEDPMFTQACHCTHCQRSTGSAFMLSLVLELGNIKIQNGQPQVCPFTGGSGQKYDLNVCSACGTALWGNRQGQSRGLAYLRAGTLDETRKLKPQAHIYTASKQEWVQLSDGAPAFTGMYKMEEVWPQSSIDRLKALI
jgi:hypothetical protein